MTMLHGVLGTTTMMLGQLQTAAPTPWWSSLWSIFLLVVGFSLVIFVHELGHFIAAKWAKVRVEKFCIGFGRELIGFTRGGTRYAFNLLPLGGYVKMLGQEDFVVDKSGELKVKDNPDSFTNKTIGQRMVIISGGVIMNLLFAAVAFAIVVMVGRLQTPPIVGDVEPDSPAARAGLQTGDKILEINGRSIRSWEELTAAVMLSDPGEELALKVRRDGHIVDPQPRVLPEFRKEDEVRRMGVTSGMNLRVFMPSLDPNAKPGPDELHKYDRLYGLAEGGKVREVSSISAFYYAVSAARGAPIEIAVERPTHPEALTDELAVQSNLNVESKEVQVRASAVWRPVPYDPAADKASGSMLGLEPRVTVLLPVPDKSFDKAGVKAGDVIVRIGTHAYPTMKELKQEIEDHPDEAVTLEVRRTREANQGLDGAAVEFCVRHRETLIAAALADVTKAAEQAAQLAAAEGLPAAEQEKLLAALNAAGDGPGWRRWLEGVDVHRVGPFIPKRPFALLSKLPPSTDAVLACTDEDHLVVADVVEKYGDRVTAAQAAGIPRGAVITAADGRPLSRWYQLCEVFRGRAGQSVELTYRVADEIRRARMDVPDCVAAALKLPPNAAITSIDGKSRFTAQTAEGKTKDIVLPDWRAVEGLLKAAVGRTVRVEYVTFEGQKGDGQYTVKADNTDPWPARVYYLPPFSCYPLRERKPEHNPVLAAGIGFRQAYDATMQTILSIRHMITGQVGLSKVSGPVGIVRIGSRMADTGVIELLWFLALISANLAVINFLPMPIVDGGLFLFLVMEKIRGEPVSIKTQIATQLIGIALIATVFILITYQDIKNWILGT